MRAIFGAVLVLSAISLVIFAVFQTATSSSELPAGMAPLPTLNTVVNVVQTAAVPTAVPTQEVVHSVTVGDTLLGIAILYDVDIDAIMEANGLDDPNTLDIGQDLVIPGVVLPTAVPLETVQAALGSGADIVPKPAFVAINGIPEEQIVVFSDEALKAARETYARGQELGRNPRAFTTAGDSTTEIPYFLGRFDEGPYNLGDYAYLQPVIDFFHGSFNHDSVSVRVGLHSWTLFDPTWSDKTRCQANEAPLPCEIRLQNPSILFIRLGSNDYGVPALFDESIREAVEYALDQGVIPVIGTKADRGEGDDSNNELLRQIAADYHLLLWDFDLLAGTMPGRGLDADNIHMTGFYSHDYTQPEAFQSGHAMHNLSALMVLDTIWKEVILPRD
ncbi:MAG: LysM peptidoglycan-binding domain-containing protein [Candidatus Promineifilaceae bacterium]